MQKIIESVESLVATPFRVFKAGAECGRSIVGQTIGIFFPPMTQAEFAQELSSEHLLEVANGVTDEIALGVEAEIPSIEFEGRARLAEVVIEAAQSPLIPDEVTTELVEMAVQAKIDPEFEPLLKDPAQRILKSVFSNFYNVKDMSRWRSNRL